MGVCMLDSSTELSNLYLDSFERFEDFTWAFFWDLGGWKVCESD